MSGSQVSQIFDTLTIDIGPRLTASPAYLRAVDFADQKLKSWGLENVHREAWKFGRGWTLKKLTLEMVEPRYMPLIGYAEGWSPSTAGELTAEPVYLGDKTAAQIEALKPSLKGAIVMPLPPQSVYVREDRPQPTAPGAAGPAVLSAPPLFRASPEAQRLNLLARAAGAGVILRPNVLSDGTVYVTGNDQGAAGVPSVILSSEHYNMIAGMIEHRLPVKLRVAVQAAYQEADTNAYNVIAEIPGVDPALKNQVVMLGAHLDSWHTGVGATDNADGVATMMEAMRILKPWAPGRAGPSASRSGAGKSRGCWDRRLGWRGTLMATRTARPARTFPSISISTMAPGPSMDSPWRTTKEPRPCSTPG